MSKRRLVIGGEEVVTPAESPKPAARPMTIAERAANAARAAGQNAEPQTYDEVRNADKAIRNRFVIRKLMVEKICPVCLHSGFGQNRVNNSKTEIHCSCGTEIWIFHGSMKHVRDIEGMTIIVDDRRYQERQEAMAPNGDPEIRPIDPAPYAGHVQETINAVQDHMVAQMGIPRETIEAMAAGKNMGIPPRVVREAMAQKASEAPRSSNGQPQHRETDNVMIAKFLSRLVCPDCTGKQLLTRPINGVTTKFFCQDCHMEIDLEWSGDIVKNGPKVNRINQEEQ